MAVAELIDVEKIYKTGDTQITALNKTSLKINKKELTLVLGPSGSGKTTLLSLLGCVIYPSVGKIIIDNVDVTDMKEKKLSSIRLNKIGFIFQNFNLVSPLSALENVMLPLKLKKIPSSQAKILAMEALEKVSLSDRANHLPKELSGGQQQRISVARALVTEPLIMLCDEPTANLDHESAIIVMDELKDIARNGRSVTVVTHDTRLREYADRIIEVKDGSITEK